MQLLGYAAEKFLSSIATSYYWSYVSLINTVVFCLSSNSKLKNDRGQSVSSAWSQDYWSIQIERINQFIIKLTVFHFVAFKYLKCENSYTSVLNSSRASLEISCCKNFLTATSYTEQQIAMMQ